MGGGGGSCWFRVGDAIDFEHFFNNKELSDVTLTIGQIKFHLHKLILVNSSDVFRTMLTHVSDLNFLGLGPTGRNEYQEVMSDSMRITISDTQSTIP